MDPCLPDLSLVRTVAQVGQGSRGDHIVLHSFHRVEHFQIHHHMPSVASELCFDEVSDRWEERIEPGWLGQDLDMLRI